jgi:hypothetical protein
MLRLTFFPNFQLYSFTFFWMVTIIFVYIYSLALAPFTDQIYLGHHEFLRVSQKALFVLGENYPYYLVIKGNYYRLLTSTVLFRNLYQFLIGSIGIISFGSYIEQYLSLYTVSSASNGCCCWPSPPEWGGSS